MLTLKGRGRKRIVFASSVIWQSIKGPGIRAGRLGLKCAPLLVAANCPCRVILILTPFPSLLLVAALLKQPWELSLHDLIWWFSNLSVLRITWRAAWNTAPGPRPRVSVAEESAFLASIHMMLWSWFGDCTSRTKAVWHSPSVMNEFSPCAGRMVLVMYHLWEKGGFQSLKTFSIRSYSLVEPRLVISIN